MDENDAKEEFSENKENKFSPKKNAESQEKPPSCQTLIRSEDKLGKEMNAKGILRDRSSAEVNGELELEEEKMPTYRDPESNLKDS